MNKKIFWLRVLLSIFVILLWQIIVDLGYIKPLFLSSPLQIMRTLVDLLIYEKFISHFMITLMETLLGFTMAVLFGASLGYIFGLYKTVREIMTPFVAALNCVPRIALIPLLFLWTGIGVKTNSIVSFILSFPSILIATTSGVIHIDPMMVESVRALGASKKQIFTYVIVPGSLPTVFVGLRTGMAFALIGSVVSEMFASQAGLGFLIQYSMGTFQTAKFFAAVITLAITGTFLDLSILTLEKRLIFWKKLGETN